LRVENKNSRQDQAGPFEVAGVFEFMDGNDRAELVAYLKKCLPTENEGANKEDKNVRQSEKES
jgi:hypothetical protein